MTDVYQKVRDKKGRITTGDIKKNAALLGRAPVFGYKVASQQS